MDSSEKNKKIMGDRCLFNDAIYTHLSDALKILEERRNDKELVAKILKLLDNDVPEVLLKEKCSVYFRQIATPNKECRHFISVSKEMNLKPVFFEYYEDKFTSNNEFKHSLGQLRIHGDIDKNGDYRGEKVTIVDFSNQDGKKLKEVVTVWNETLVDFHKKLFNHLGLIESVSFFEASEWLKSHGKKASIYYTNFFLLFTCFGILFENFLLDGTEGDFSRDIVLPAIEKVVELTGVRPLIVPIHPLDTEKDEHCISYDPKIKEILNKNKLHEHTN